MRIFSTVLLSTAMIGAFGSAWPAMATEPATRKPFTFQDAAETDRNEGAGLVTASAAAAAAKRAIVTKRIQEGTTSILADTVWKRGIHPRALTDKDISSIVRDVSGKVDVKSISKVPAFSPIIEIELDSPQISRVIGRQNELALDNLDAPPMGSDKAARTGGGGGGIDIGGPVPGEGGGVRGPGPSGGGRIVFPVDPPFNPDMNARMGLGERVSNFTSSIFGGTATDNLNPQMTTKTIVLSEHGEKSLKVLRDELRALQKSGIAVQSVRFKTPGVNFALRSLGAAGNAFIVLGAGAGVSRIVNASSIYLGMDPEEMAQPYLSENAEKPSNVEFFFTSAKERAFQAQHGAAAK